MFDSQADYKIPVRLAFKLEELINLIGDKLNM